jgi:hypothetical protein
MLIDLTRVGNVLVILIHMFAIHDCKLSLIPSGTLGKVRTLSTYVHLSMGSVNFLASGVLGHICKPNKPIKSKIGR